MNSGMLTNRGSGIQVTLGDYRGISSIMVRQNRKLGINDNTR